MPIITNSPYTLLINGEKSYPILREGFSLKRVAGAEGKHRTSSCSVSVRGSSVLSDIMYAKGLVDAVVRDNAGNVLFTGVIRPYASVNVNQYHMDAIHLEVMDYTEKMHLRIYEKVESSGDHEIEYDDDVIFSQPWPDVKVCDPSDTENSVVHKICKLCGVDVVEAPSIPVSLYGFELEYGNYLDDVLSTLLYEYVYDFEFDAQGKMHIFQTGPILDPSQKDGNGNPVIHDIPGTPTNLANLRKKLSVKRSDDSKDGAVVTYPKYDTKSVEVWSRSYSSNAGLISGGINIISDDDVSWNSTWKNGLKKATLSGFWLSFSDDSVWAAGVWCLEKSLSNCTQSGGHVYCKVNMTGGLFGQYKARLSVHATAYYLTDDTRVVGYAGNNSENYSARYIQNPEYATALANAIRTRCKYNNFSYSFDSFVELEPGSIVIIDEPNISGVSAKVRITSRAMSDETGLFHYEAEGYGESTFSTPAVDRDDTPSLPQDEPDWMLMKISEDLILPDDADATPIMADAYGAIFDKYGASPAWYLNNVPLTDLTSLHIELSKTRFSPGSNVIKLAASYDGETYELGAVVKCFSPDLSISMQYAVLDEGEEPDGTTVWMSTQPDPGEGQIVWVRFRVSESADWIVLRWTGENGGNPIIYFQWAATPYVRPDDGVDLMTWDTMAIVWECPDGSLMGFTAQTGAWSETVPDRPRGLNYLWVKYWNYKTKAWDFFCTTGTPAMSFDLIVNPQTFKLTSRGVVAEGTNGEDQRIIVHCLPINSTAPASWELDDGTPEGLTPVVSWDENWTGFNNLDRCIRIAAGKALPSFTIRCSIADIDMAKEFVVSGVQEGKAEMAYLGVYESLEELSQVTSTPEGPLMYGDYALVETEEGRRKPYYWTGTEWAFAGANTPVGLAGKIMLGSLYDALNAEETEESMSVIDLFVKHLAADNIFANYALIHNLLVGLGDGTGDSGFRVRIGYLEDGVTPVFDVMWGSKTSFRIDPQTGKVFFGQPNAALSSPSSGFMYSPSDGSIRSRNDNIVISSEGKITAKSATITEKSFFSGNFQCDAIVSRAGQSSSISISSSVSSLEQTRQLLNQIIGNGLEENTIYAVSLSGYPHARWMKYVKDYEDSVDVGAIAFYDAAMNLIKESSGILPITTDWGSDPSMHQAYWIYNDFSIGRRVRYGAFGKFISGGVSISVLRGGDVLLLTVPIAPSESELASFETGQVYADEGFLKIK